MHCAQDFGSAKYLTPNRTVTTPFKNPTACSRASSAKTATLARASCHSGRFALLARMRRTTMRIRDRHAAALALVGLYLMVSSASAQQPAPAAPLNPQWCSDVPASPPPPNLEHHLGDWAILRNRCMNNRSDLLCAPLCQDAKDRWKQQKAGLLNHPSSFPAIPANPAVPQWYTDAPASPPPPGFEHRPGNWANVRKMCAQPIVIAGVCTSVSLPWNCGV